MHLILQQSMLFLDVLVALYNAAQLCVKNLA